MPALHERAAYVVESGTSLRKSKVKGRGQECPRYTNDPVTLSRAEPLSGKAKSKVAGRNARATRASVYVVESGASQEKQSQRPRAGMPALHERAAYVVESGTSLRKSKVKGRGRNARATRTSRLRCRERNLSQEKQSQRPRAGMPALHERSAYVGRNVPLCLLRVRSMLDHIRRTYETRNLYSFNLVSVGVLADEKPSCNGGSADHSAAVEESDRRG